MSIILRKRGEGRKAVIKILKKIFSEDWLRENKDHPLAVELKNSHLFFNSLLRLGKNLQLIEGCKAAQELIRRLKNRQEYFGALFELEVAAEFIKRGFEIEFQPRLANGRVCDAFVKQKNLFVESKTLGRSNVERRIFEIALEAVKAIGHRRDLQIRIGLTNELLKLLELLNAFRLTVQESLMAAIKRALVQGLVKPWKGISAFAKIKCRKARKLSICILGPKISESEFSKLASWCIDRASKQLPKDMAGIIALQFFGSCTQDREIIRRILRNYGHIAAVVLYQAYYLNGFLYRRKVVKNPNLKVTLS